MNAHTREDQLVQDLVGCCHFASTMADLIRTQFNETLQASLDAAQFEEWDKALRAIVLRMDTGIYAARAALAASWAASSAAVGGRA